MDHDHEIIIFLSCGSGWCGSEEYFYFWRFSHKYCKEQDFLPYACSRYASSNSPEKITYRDEYFMKINISPWSRPPCYILDRWIPLLQEEQSKKRCLLNIEFIQLTFERCSLSSSSLYTELCLDSVIIFWGKPVRSSHVVLSVMSRLKRNPAEVTRQLQVQVSGLYVFL